MAETALEGELIPAGEVDARLVQDSGFRAIFLSAVAARFGEFEGVIENVLLESLDVRLARSLLRLADAQGVVRASHEKLAAEAGSARAVVSRHMAAMVRDGLVDQGRGRIVLTNPSALERIAAGNR